MSDERSPSVDEVASIVRHRASSTFVELLKLAAPRFEEDGFEMLLGARLRREPQLVEQWDLWGGDQRWTPSAYIDGTQVGWYDGAHRYVQQHQDRAAAVADFVHRLAVWVAERRVIGDGEPSGRSG